MKIFTLKTVRDLNRLVLQGKITFSKMVELMNEAVNIEIDNNIGDYVLGSGHEHIILSIKQFDKEEGEDYVIQIDPSEGDGFEPTYDEVMDNLSKNTMRELGLLNNLDS